MPSTLDTAVLNGICASVFGRIAYTCPATTLYAAFIVNATTALTGGTEVSTSGTGYSRTAVVNNQTMFPAPSGGVTTNASTITAPTSTAAWHTTGQQVNAVRFYDAATGGNLVGGSMLTPAATVDATGITLSIPAGQLSLTVA